MAEDIYQQLAARHGHYCPMSTLGVRLGEALVQQLAAANNHVQSVTYHAQTCAVDGLSLVLERQFPELSLTVQAKRQHSLHCQLEDGGELSLSLSERAMQLAAQYRHLQETEQEQQLDLLRHCELAELIKIVEDV